MRRRWKLFEEGMDDNEPKLQSLVGYRPQQFYQQLYELRIPFRLLKINEIFLTEYLIEILGALATLRLTDDILIAGIKRLFIVKQLV